MPAPGFIVKFPDSCLRRRTMTVDALTDAIRELCGKLGDAMLAANGAGLAAPQLGFSERIFVVDPVVAGQPEEHPPLVFINPEMVWLSTETETRDEGCLSFPDVFVPVKRALKARIRATNLNGEQFEMEAEGLCARAFQHELDHLNGKLLIDYVGPLRKQLIRRKLKRQAEGQADDEQTEKPGTDTEV
ncbi:MAG: peptide deformylase [Pseudomonadota bacterium]